MLSTKDNPSQSLRSILLTAVSKSAQFPLLFQSLDFKVIELK